MTNASPLVLAEDLRAASDERLQWRALFWRMSKFTWAGPIDDSNVAVSAMRGALGYIYGESALSTSPAQLHALWLACGVLRNMFDDDGGLKDDADGRSLGQAVHNLIMAGVLELEFQVKGDPEYHSIIPAGEIVLDGLEIVRAGTGIRRCPVCGEVFAPLRADANFCSPKCRNTHVQRTTRQRKKGAK